MRMIALSALLVALAVTSTGCAPNALVGHGATWTGQYYSDVGIVGDDNTLTVLKGSRVLKLSIIGHNCNITLEDGATLNRVEFAGEGNTVSLPSGMIVRSTQVGGNQIIRRKPEPIPGAEWAPQEAPPGNDGRRLAPPLDPSTGMPAGTRAGTEPPPPTEDEVIEFSPSSPPPGHEGAPAGNAPQPGHEPR